MLYPIIRKRLNLRRMFSIIKKTYENFLLRNGIKKPAAKEVNGTIQISSWRKPSLPGWLS